MSPFKNEAGRLAEQKIRQQENAAIVEQMTKFLEKLNRTVQQMDVETATNILVKPQDLGLLMKNQSKQFRYALHGLMVVLIAENCADILRKMADSNLELLKELVEIAQKCEPIDTKYLKEDASKRIGAERLEMLKQIVALWPEITTALNGLANDIDGVQKERVKDARRMAMKNAMATTIEQKIKESYAGEVMSMEKAAKELGFSSMVGLCIKINRFLEKHPRSGKKLNSWFVFNGKTRKGLKVECFDACKQALQAKKKSDKKAEKVKASKKKEITLDENVIKISELAKKLGISEGALRNKLSRFLRATDDEHRIEVNSWFICLENRPDCKTAFKIQFMDKFIELFPLSKGRKSGAAKQEVKEPVEQQAETIEQPNNVAEIVPAQPNDMVSVVALEKILNVITNEYANAVSTQQESEKRYNESVDALKVAPTEQRKDLLADAQRANEESETSRAKAEKLRRQINEATDLLERKREAENKLYAVMDEIDFFIQKHNEMQY